MSFSDRDAWDDKCAAKNAEYGGYNGQTEKVTYLVSYVGQQATTALTP